MLIIYEVVKQKTSARGYWINEKGKLFKDNIKFAQINNALDFEKCLSDLFLKGEEAIFYTTGKTAYIESKGGITNLTKKIIYIKKHLKPSFIKSLLKEYKGLTVYYSNDFKGYTVEIWQE